MITYNVYNNGYNNPMYNVYKTMGIQYTCQNMVIVNIPVEKKVKLNVK